MQHEGVTCLRTHPTAAALQLSGGRASRAWWRAASSLCPCCGSRDSCDRGECGRGSRVEGEEERQEVGGGEAGLSTRPDNGDLQETAEEDFPRCHTRAPTLKLTYTHTHTHSHTLIPHHTGRDTHTRVGIV